MNDFDMPAFGTWEARGGWVVRALMRDLGLTAEQAAGLVGNLGHESLGFTELQEISPLVPGSRGGTGWAQWTGVRRRAFEAWCADAKLDPKSDRANYGFLLHELRGEFDWFLAKLRSTRTLADACRVTHEFYERPADVQDGSFRSGASRLGWARRALAGATRADTDDTQALIDAHIAASAALQTRLRDLGYYRFAIDGDWGKLSRAALLAYHTRRGA